MSERSIFRQGYWDKRLTRAIHALRIPHLFPPRAARESLEPVEGMKEGLQRSGFPAPHRQAVGIVEFHRTVFFQHGFDFVRVANRDDLQRVGI